MKRIVQKRIMTYHGRQILEISPRELIHFAVCDWDAD